MSIVFKYRQESFIAFRFWVSLFFCVVPPCFGCSLRHEQLDVFVEQRTVTLEVWRPADGAAHPVVLLLHGSAGFRSEGNPESRLGDLGEKQLACRGRVAAIPHYFSVLGVKFLLRPPTPAEVELLMKTLREVVDKIEKQPFALKGQTAFFGESLGGFVAIHYGLIDRRVRRIFVTGAGVDPASFARVSNAPGVFMFHGIDDKVVPLDRAKQDCGRLNSIGVPCHFVVLGHERHILSERSRRRIFSRIIKET